ENDEGYQMWMSHGDEVKELAPGFEVIGSTPDCPYAAIYNKEKNLYGLQFHPEVTHSLQGNKILENFISNICNIQKNWALDKTYVQEKIEEIKSQVGNKKVFLLVSGGVDSTVAFALIAKAVGNENVYGLFVDTGFMRENERQEVETSLKGIGVNLHVYDAAKEYFQALKGKYSPEEKRIIIGNLFLEIKDKVSRDLGLNEDEWLLGQGTIYPDTIESGGTKHADKIKTHHNRVDKIQELIEKGQLIEPLADLYKDEVRKVGEILGLPQEMVWRHPFPGPGLAVRCLCIENEEKVEQTADSFEITKILDADLIKSATILPVKSVGVQGDERSYRHPIALAGNWNNEKTQKDQEAMWQKLEKTSTNITNKSATINRSIYCLTQSEITEATVIPSSYLTPARIELLQKVDHIVTQTLHATATYKTVWQFPVVLAPITINNNPGESIILRPVLSQEAMTAQFARLPFNVIEQMVNKISAIQGISAIFYDITNKPPGTIEWE
ncbi:glutamine-hydrolyzing GMP synthase, partial [Patescibacteria group bacterium]|nr:glutamine-hydrolyzing GMP synthase [Patescibacteria group bacterium]